MKNNHKKLVYIAVMIYALIIGLSFLFGKIALSTANPLDLLAHRFTAAFLAILLLRCLKLVKLNYTKEKVKKIIPLAILYPLTFFAFQTFGLQYASSSEAGILSASTPVITLILATFFLNEKTTLAQKISIIASVSGVVYISLMKGSSFEWNNINGIILLLLSALSFSGYSILARILTKDFSSIELSIIMVIISFVSFNTMAIARNLINGTISTFLLPLGNFQFVISVIYLGVLSSLVTSLLTNFILSKIEASKMSVFSNLGTVISIFAGVIFLNEKVFYYHIIGCILIIGGVLGANFLEKKPLNND